MKLLRIMFLPALLAIAVTACTTYRTPEAPVSRIAFGSCSDQKLPQPVWEAVRSYNPDLFLFLGDNVYGDVSSGEMRELRQAYEMFSANSEVAALRRETDVMAAWDDHDYGRNDAGGDFPWRRASQKLFLDFWNVPDGDRRRRRDGIYIARTQGPPGQRVQVILLDTRFFRSRLKKSGARRPKYLPDPDPGKTMLGPAQWTWLESELRKPADLRLVVSSVQVVADGHGWESWGNLPAERQRLFDLIRRTRANGVIFLSGDRHFGAAYKEPSAGAYPLYEFTSSSLNRPWRGANEFGRKQIVPPVGEENFGTIDIDWRSRQVTVSMRGLDGTPVQTKKVSLNELRP